ncbi:hypothetical protein BCR33DRAFT_782768 [Rhizoclosmatium globosum]|uniref:Uncharacterized protein n=1 Tax=Rhizoclosmatium globosum TaxID=329046 RepID=A0A1Y2CKX3_9FUNG|nr:hypothetical protein BCR33DRAFT_782768 [Rhizoclosmatium globosum]|eukprot:ORY47668.1 hypothetical protein BCR33DRAFT_782768 [Rhizoclosmatium globosum]
MNRTEEKLKDLEVRFSRLSNDGQDCLQAIANWTITRARSVEDAWDSEDVVDWKSDRKPSSFDDIASSRISLLSILKLMDAIVKDMNAVLASFVRDYSNLLQDVEVLAKVQSELQSRFVICYCFY